MEANIIEPFSSVGAQCREVRDDVKLSFSAKEKELIRRRSVDKIRQRNPRNRQKIVCKLSKNKQIY
jgi:protein FAM92